MSTGYFGTGLFQTIEVKVVWYHLQNLTVVTLQEFKQAFNRAKAQGN